jgi:hypothetical protein
VGKITQWNSIVISEELSIPVRKITNKMLGQSDTDKNVLRLLQTALIQHTHNKFSKIKKLELNALNLLRSFPL